WAISVGPRARDLRGQGAAASGYGRGGLLASSAMLDLGYFVFLVADGAMAGSIYALVALAFVVVYKASRMMNFAVGEWTMLGARTAAAASYSLGLGLGGAVAAGCAGLIALALVFNRVGLRPLKGSSLLPLIMLTPGVGIFMPRAAAVGVA